jgi:hypothetical protein
VVKVNVHLIVKENGRPPIVTENVRHQVVRVNFRLLVEQYDRQMVKNMSCLVKENGLYMVKENGRYVVK